MIMGLIMWVYIGTIHILFINPLKEHIDGIVEDCKCNPYIPEVAEVGAKVRAYQMKLAELECQEICPIKADYDAEMEKRKAEAAKARRSVNPEDEDVELRGVGSESEEDSGASW